MLHQSETCRVCIITYVANKLHFPPSHKFQIQCIQFQIIFGESFMGKIGYTCVLQVLVLVCTFFSLLYCPVLVLHATTTSMQCQVMGVGMGKCCE